MITLSTLKSFKSFFSIKIFFTPNAGLFGHFAKYVWEYQGNTHRCAWPQGAHRRKLLRPAGQRVKRDTSHRPCLSASITRFINRKLVEELRSASSFALPAHCPGPPPQLRSPHLRGCRAMERKETHRWWKGWKRRQIKGWACSGCVPGIYLAAELRTTASCPPPYLGQARRKQLKSKQWHIQVAKGNRGVFSLI